MKWTQEVPTKAGFYWTNAKFAPEIFIVWVVEDTYEFSELKFYFPCLDYSYSSEEMKRCFPNALYYGPLLHPKLPELPKLSS